jgi:hypothetical protein
MTRHSSVILALLATGLAIAPASARDETIERVRLASGLEIVIGERQIEPRRELVAAIAAWVGAKLDRPVPAVLPRVLLVPATRIAALRFRQDASDRVAQEGPSNIVSIYDTRERIVYLPESWSGATAADLSVLVHELVHHFQIANAEKFDCPAQREAAAFELQEKWLRLFGSTLEAEFQVDPFSLLVRTSCGM